MIYVDTYPVSVGSQTIELPLVPIAADRAISLLMTIDQPLSFIERAGVDLAALIEPLRPEAIATAATLGIPIATAVASALGLDRVFVLQKTAKIHLQDALNEPLESITTHGEQSLRLDRRYVDDLRERRVVFVDDVVATGGSVVASLRLLRRAGATVAGVAAILVEGDGWRPRLGDDAELVRALGTIPLFGAADGGWTPLDEPDGA
ncbi:MAG: phosphoribosyltransferase family protein [Actinomycetota bacterium]